MIFTTEFDIGEDVFIIKDDKIQTAKVVKIHFPEPSLLYNHYTNNEICYYVWPKSYGPLPESLSWANDASIPKNQNEIGKDVSELLMKLKENSKIL